MNVIKANPINLIVAEDINDFITQNKFRYGMNMPCSVLSRSINPAPCQRPPSGFLLGRQSRTMMSSPERSM